MKDVDFGISLRINRFVISKRLKCALLVLPFLEPKGMLNYLGSAWVRGWQYLVLLDVLILVLLMGFIDKKVHKLYILYGLFFMPIAISTVLNDREILPALYFPAKMIGFAILIAWYVRTKKLYDLLSVLKGVMGVYILITLFFQIFAQDFFGHNAISKNYMNFFVSDNFLGYWYVSFIMLVYILEKHKSKSQLGYGVPFWAIICMLSLIRAWSATNLVIFVLFLALFMLRKVRVIQMITPLNALLINMGISAMFIFFHVQNLFEWLIVGVLHKDLTISGRVNIWAAAIRNILQKPWLGYGTDMNGRLTINIANGGRAWFSHNIFLEVMIQGGVIALIILVIIYFVANNEMRSLDDDFGIRTVIMLALFTILLMQFSEFSFYEPFVNLPLMLCFFYKQLMNGLE